MQPEMQPILFPPMDIEIVVSESSDDWLVGRVCRLYDFKLSKERKTTVRASLYQKGPELHFRTEQGEYIQGLEV